MYSSKLVNQRLVDGNAYITVGDPYQDPKPNPFRNLVLKDGKKLTPFQIQGKPKNAENGCFSRIEYKGGDVQDVIHYIKEQPLEKRKNGFGTKDADRRDEFANAMRTEQYRATIRREQELVRSQEQQQQQQLVKSKKNGSQQPETNDRTLQQQQQEENNGRDYFLYDIGRSRVTEFDPKTKRDTYYRRNNNNNNNTGGTATATTTTGSALKLTASFLPIAITSWGHELVNSNSTSYTSDNNNSNNNNKGGYEYKAPEFGGHCAIAHFYDKSHLRL